MKKMVIKGAILASVFVLSLWILSIVMNQGNTDMTTEMREATFPVISMQIGGHEVNTLHGYARDMNTAYIRESLLPIRSDRTVTARIDTYDRELSDISFEVRSLNGERLVESTKVTKYEEKNGRISFDITLKDLIDANTEYMLIFVLTPTEGDIIKYYTRIVQNDDLHIQEKLDYIVDFHEKTFDKEEAAELTKYLESNAEGDNTTFHKVTIHSSFNQITWGDLNITKVAEPAIKIKELTEQTGSFQIEYLVSEKNGKDTVMYRVEEYYRIRYTPDRMYLLDFDREMTQIFDESADVYVNDKIMLGIAGNEVILKESDGGNVFAFVIADKLYSYNVTDNKIARLFSFYGNTEKMLDKRSSYNGHDIKILNVDETGNVAFMVYGYMNRGRHEGEVGVVVYHYNSMRNTVEEQIYIPYTKSYDLLKEEIDKLSYINKTGTYYFMMNGNVYAVNLEEENYQIIASGLQEGGYHVSDSNRMLVWQEGGDIHTSDRLILMNLNTQEQITIRAGGGEYISVLGFMEDDLVYGLARQRDIVTNHAGATVFPMYCVKIQGDNGDILKTYRKNNIYVTGSTIEGNQMNLSRVVWNEEEEKYERTADDQIMNTEEVRAGSNTISSVVTEKFETIIEIAVKDEIDSKSLKLLTPKEVLFEGNRTITVPEPENTPKLYYVYGNGGIQGVYEASEKAVALAYEMSGVVVDDDGKYIWKKDSRSVRNQIMAITEDSVTDTKTSVAVCLDTILKFEGISRNSQRMLDRGESVISILESNLPDCDILDLSDCSLDAVLYYVNQDIPVMAMLEDGNAVLITGFNELNIVVMDPLTGTLYKKGMNDSTEWLRENGNQFITYVRKE